MAHTLKFMVMEQTRWC